MGEGEKVNDREEGTEERGGWMEEEERGGWMMDGWMDDWRGGREERQG